jgi:hypothetical protein
MRGKKCKESYNDKQSTLKRQLIEDVGNMKKIEGRDELKTAFYECVNKYSLELGKLEKGHIGDYLKAVKSNCEGAFSESCGGYRDQQESYIEQMRGITKTYRMPESQLEEWENEISLYRKHFFHTYDNLTSLMLTCIDRIESFQGKYLDENKKNIYSCIEKIKKLKKTFDACLLASGDKDISSIQTLLKKNADVFLTMTAQAEKLLKLGAMSVISQTEHQEKILIANLEGVRSFREKQFSCFSELLGGETQAETIDVKIGQGKDVKKMTEEERDRKKLCSEAKQAHEEHMDRQGKRLSSRFSRKFDSSEYIEHSGRIEEVICYMDTMGGGSDSVLNGIELKYEHERRSVLYGTKGEEATRLRLDPDDDIISVDVKENDKVLVGNGNHLFPTYPSVVFHTNKGNKLACGSNITGTKDPSVKSTPKIEGFHLAAIKGINDSPSSIRDLSFVFRRDSGPKRIQTFLEARKNNAEDIDRFVSLSDDYAILGCSKDSTREEVDAQYKTLEQSYLSKEEGGGWLNDLREYHWVKVTLAYEDIMSKLSLSGRKKKLV